MMSKEQFKQTLSTSERLQRSTEFLVRFKDMLEGRLDSFERGLIDLVTDEYINIFNELNKRGK